MLLKDANIFGLAVLGDGATVRKLPLLNFLVFGVHAPAEVLKIVDCTGHLQGGGGLDAKFMSHVFEPHMAKIEPMK